MAVRWHGVVPPFATRPRPLRISRGARSLLAASFATWASDSPTCAFASLVSRPCLCPRRRPPSSFLGTPSSASTEISSDSASCSSIYSDPSSSAGSFIGSSSVCSGLSCLSRQFPDLAFSRATALASSPTRPSLPRPRPRPLVAALVAAFRGCWPAACSSALSCSALCRLVPALLRRFARSRRECVVGYPAVPNPPEAQGGLAPVLLEHKGAGTPSRPREPVYRSPRGRTHPHLRARRGSFRPCRPPRPPPALQRQIVGPHLQPRSPLVSQPHPPLPRPTLSQHSSQQQSSGPAASSLPLAQPPPPSDPPLSASTSHPPPPPLSPPTLSSDGAALVPPLPDPSLVAADPPSELPQRQHPLVPHDPAPVARFPLPRALSPELLPDAPHPEDDEKWWNGELWESPPQSGTTWGRDWEIRSDFVLDVLCWEHRMIGVGECLSHVATALEQLHAGLESRNVVLRDPQLTEEQQGVVRAAAAQGLWRLLRLPLEFEHPDENEGLSARAFRRVATAAEEEPLQLVPALASLLRRIPRRFYVLNHV
ncbi:unnamed protein product [Closterium sp. Naga37s-1]|nr:unnamed protein product [Closterium sp. Naga37s-1]